MERDYTFIAAFYKFLPISVTVSSLNATDAWQKALDHFKGVSKGHIIVSITLTVASVKKKPNLKLVKKEKENGTQTF